MTATSQTKSQINTVVLIVIISLAIMLGIIFIIGLREGAFGIIDIFNQSLGDMR